VNLRNAVFEFEKGIASKKPGTSKLFGSPRRIGSSLELSREFNLGYQSVRKHQAVVWDSLRYDDGSQVMFSSKVPDTLPEMALLYAHDARVLGSDGWPVVGRDHLISDSHFIHELREFRSYERFTVLPHVRKLAGVSLNLGAAFSGNNYGHALLDGLGKLALAAEGKVAPEDVDHVLLPSFFTPAMERILLAAGYDREKWITLRRGGHIYCEDLINPTFPGHPRVYSSILSDFFRNFTNSPNQGRRRLYVSRLSGRRLISNPGEIAEIMTTFGFELYDPAKSGSSPDDFAAAEIVVGAHGAGLSDLVFCQPGTKIVEIIPSGHRYPYFASLAVSGGLEYIAIPGASTDQTSHSDFDVNATRLRRVLEGC
jgi:capsular polysaccharide biosynthesis protein